MRADICCTSLPNREKDMTWGRGSEREQERKVRLGAGAWTIHRRGVLGQEDHSTCKEHEDRT